MLPTHDRDPDRTVAQSANSVRLREIIDLFALM